MVFAVRNNDLLVCEGEVANKDGSIFIRREDQVRLRPAVHGKFDRLAVQEVVYVRVQRARKMGENFFRFVLSHGVDQHLQIYKLIPCHFDLLLQTSV